MGQGREQKKNKNREVDREERESEHKKPPASSAVADGRETENQESPQSTDDKVISPDGYPDTKKEEPPLF